MRETDPCGECLSAGNDNQECNRCGVIRKKWVDVPPEMCRLPDMDMMDFERVLKSKPISSSVTEEEVARYEEWTAEHGESGA